MKQAIFKSSVLHIMMVQPKDHSLRSQAHLISWLSCTYSQVSLVSSYTKDTSSLHIQTSVHPLFLPWIHLSILLSIHPLIHPSFLLNRNQPITEEDILPSISPCINPCLLSIHLSTHPSIHPSFLTHNHPLTNLSVLFFSSFHPSIYPYIEQDAHPFPGIFIFILFNLSKFV